MESRRSERGWPSKSLLMSVPSPGASLPGSREARPVETRPMARRSEPLGRGHRHGPPYGYPGEARPRPSWSLCPAPPPPVPASRSVRLLTLERDIPPTTPRGRGRGRERGRKPGPSVTRRDLSQGTGLREWMSTLLKDRASVQLDTTNICMVLHCLWKRPTCRQAMLDDPEFRRKAFNAFVMDVLKAYQLREKSEDIDTTGLTEAVKTKKEKLWDVTSLPVAVVSKPAASAAAPARAPPVGTIDGDDDGHDDAFDDAFDGARDDVHEDAPGPDDDPEWRDASPEPSPPEPPEQPASIRKRGRPFKTTVAALRRRGWRMRPPAKEQDGEGGDSPSKDAPKSKRRGADRRRRKLISEGEQVVLLDLDALEPPPSAASSGDLCGRVTGAMMRKSGRKAWVDGEVLRLAARDEDTSGVPDSSFLFIRCARCPELVLVDYPAIRRHWELKCHFLSCILCDMTFNSSRLALAHLRVEHKDPVPDGWYRLVRCHPCGRAGFYSTEQVIGHMAGHRSERARNPAVFPPFLTCYKRIRCNQCGLKILNHRTELEDHYKRDPPPPCHHEPDKPPPLPCPVCRRVWAGAAALAAHVRISRGHCKETVAAVTAVKPGGRRVDSAYCPACSRAMDPGESMADHLLTHLAPGLRCVQCGLVVGTHQEMQAHWTFTWRCDCSACDTHVGRGARLLQHIIEDHDWARRLTGTERARPRRCKEDRGVCPVCGRLSNRLNDHMKEAHTTRFCPCCNKEVKLGTYRNHQAKIRNIDKLRCKVCGKELCSGWSLRTHMRMHTGERPYTCNLCDAAYAQKVVLKTHMKAVHGVLLPPGPGGAELVAPPMAITEMEVSSAEVLFY